MENQHRKRNINEVYNLMIHSKWINSSDKFIKFIDKLPGTITVRFLIHKKQEIKTHDVN